MKCKACNKTMTPREITFDITRETWETLCRLCLSITFSSLTREHRLLLAEKYGNKEDDNSK